MEMISACLTGFRCRYDGTGKPDKKAIEMVKSGKAIPFCPEQAGGAQTPRIPCEIVGGTGADVLCGKASVIRKDGEDCTQIVVNGAKEALRIAQLYGIKKVYLKTRSPSCGCTKIYDGTFSGTLIDGDGVTTALLRQAGIEVVPMG